MFRLALLLLLGSIQTDNSLAQTVFTPFPTPSPTDPPEGSCECDGDCNVTDDRCIAGVTIFCSVQTSSFQGSTSTTTTCQCTKGNAPPVCGIRSQDGSMSETQLNTLAARPKDQARRRLQGSSNQAFAAKMGDPTYETLVAKCGSFQYPLFLFVDEKAHLSVYGVPPTEAMDMGCPFFTSHMTFPSMEDPDTGLDQDNHMEVFLWNEVQDGLAMFEDLESFPLGSFPMGDLASAHNDVVASNSDANSSYNIVTNNCATHLLKVANKLDIPVDSRVTSFVARRLVEEAGRDLANAFRGTFFGNRRANEKTDGVDNEGGEPTDQELVASLVDEVVALGH